MKQLLWALVASTSVATYSHAQANLHAPFDVLLQKYVSASGKVDYKGFRAEKAALGTYLTALGKQVPTARSDKNAALAYWINAYNAFTIQLIVENYPVKSITQLSGGKPWDVKFIELGGKKYSLNQIENDIIRPQFKDARIHFALNCAAVSCPPLANTAYTEANVQALLTARTKRFVNNPDANTLSATKATLSKLFDWYKADFGNLPAFINQYSTIQLNANAVIAYKEYDWNLNDR